MTLCSFNLYSVFYRRLRSWITYLVLLSIDVDKRLGLFRSNVAYADFRWCDATDNIEGAPVAYVDVIIHDDNAMENCT